MEPDASMISGSRVKVALQMHEGDNGRELRATIEKSLKDMGALEVKITSQLIPTAQIRAEKISKTETPSSKLRVYWEVVEPPDAATQSDMLDKLSELEVECNQAS